MKTLMFIAFIFVSNPTFVWAGEPIEVAGVFGSIAKALLKNADEISTTGDVITHGAKQGALRAIAKDTNAQQNKSVKSKKHKKDIKSESNSGPFIVFLVTWVAGMIATWIISRKANCSLSRSFSNVMASIVAIVAFGVITLLFAMLFVKEISTITALIFPFSMILLVDGFIYQVRKKGSTK